MWSSPYNRYVSSHLVQTAQSNPELDIFSKIQDGGRSHLGFSSCDFGTFGRFDSVVLELCTKFGSNICYSH